MAQGPMKSKTAETISSAGKKRKIEYCGNAKPGGGSKNRGGCRDRGGYISK